MNLVPFLGREAASWQDLFAIVAQNGVAVSPNFESFPLALGAYEVLARNDFFPYLNAFALGGKPLERLSHFLLIVFFCA